MGTTTSLNVTNTTDTATDASSKIKDSGNADVTSTNTNADLDVQIESTTVSNTITKNSVILYYSSTKMDSTTLIQGNSLLSPQGVHQVTVPPMDHISCPVEDGYVTAFKVDNNKPSFCPDGKPLFQNYQVQKHSGQYKPFLITEDGVKFAKQGELWKDEEGNNYHPGGI